jgi:hypothetical protein
VLEGAYTWAGTISDGILQGPKEDRKYPIRDFVYALFADEFMTKGIDDVIYEYEKLPHTADVLCEKPEIYLGDEMNILVKDIRDSRGNPANCWWRVLVGAEKGKILNGEEYEEGLRVFQVGEYGEVLVRYSPPDVCPETTKEDVLRVYNTCEMLDEHPPIPADEIASLNVSIVCPIELEVQLVVRNGLYCYQGISEVKDIGNVKLIPISESEVLGTLAVDFDISRQCEGRDYPIVSRITCQGMLTFWGTYRDATHESILIVLSGDGWVYIHEYSPPLLAEYLYDLEELIANKTEASRLSFDGDTSKWFKHPVNEEEIRAYYLMTSLWPFLEYPVECDCKDGNTVDIIGMPLFWNWRLIFSVPDDHS